jgi:hypothetical protein
LGGAGSSLEYVSACAERIRNEPTVIRVDAKMAVSYSIEMWPNRRFHRARTNASISSIVLYKASEARTVLPIPKRRRIG